MRFSTFRVFETLSGEAARIYYRPIPRRTRLAVVPDEKMFNQGIDGFLPLLKFSVGKALKPLDSACPQTCDLGRALKFMQFLTLRLRFHLPTGIAKRCTATAAIRKVGVEWVRRSQSVSIRSRGSQTAAPLEGCSVRLVLNVVNAECYRLAVL